MSSLIVLLPRSNATASTEFHGLLADGRGALAQPVQASLLPAPTGTGSEVVAVVPASKLSWHLVDLPRGTGPRTPRLRAILEGLLEDRLLDDPADLHLALAPGGAAEGANWVAACDRAWLRDALQVLDAAGRPANRIVPEFTPEGAPALYAVGTPEEPLLVCTSSDGVLVLPLAAASLPLLPKLPEDTQVLAEPAVAGAAEQVLQHQPQLLPQSDRLRGATRTRWDLAQLEFATTGRARTLKKLSVGWAELLRSPQWRPARWGALALVLVQLVGLNAWAWKERSALAGKQEEQRTILKQSFPQITYTENAPVQMERNLAQLRQSAGGLSGRDLEAMLGALATATPAGKTPAGIEYSAGELRVRGLATGDAQVQPIVQALRRQGYAATAQGDTLTVRPEGTP